jgi:hypothetical protein
MVIIKETTTNAEENASIKGNNGVSVGGNVN